MKHSLFHLFLALCYIQPIFGESLPLDTVMTVEQQQEMGLNTLTPEQKKSLEAWLGDWTKKVIDQIPSYHPSKGLQRWIAGWPKHAAPLNQAPIEEVHKEQKIFNRRIDQIKNNGGLIELLDGSVWEIPTYEQHKTKSWQRGDTIDWRKTEVESPPYRLTNSSRHQIVDARMQHAPAETGKKEVEQPDTFVGAVEMTAVLNKGHFIRLADGTVWKIAPTDQKQVMTWKISDRIRVTKTENYLYPNRLINLDNGNTALANPGE